MSLRKQVLKLAYEVREGALDSTLSVSSLLRRCLTICHMLKRDAEWIKLELDGYDIKWETMGELMKNVPSYRHVNLLYRDIYGNPVLIPHKARDVTNYVLSNSIPQVEGYKDGMRIVGGVTDLIRDTFKVPIGSADVSSGQLLDIIESVRNRVLEFANNIILELEYGGILSSIFEETRKFVDSKLVDICPSAIEKLTKTYCDLVTGSSPLEWSQIAFACRDILQDFTDSIYSQKYLPKDEKPPRREETKRKVKFTLRSRTSKRNTERELIESQIDYLLNYFDKLVNLVNKDAHPVGFEVEKEDAHRCVIYTYLIIGDILRLLG